MSSMQRIPSTHRRHPSSSYYIDNPYKNTTIVPQYLDDDEQQSGHTFSDKSLSIRIPSDLTYKYSNNLIPSTTSQPLVIQTTQSRGHSSLSSNNQSSIVYDGCGGHCRTCENICYFLLQLIFMMGILIGTSLSIAGLVLKHSAARNLQVFIYIGVLLVAVCSLLLGVQWRARNASRKRRQMLKNAKQRIPIEMDTIRVRQSSSSIVRRQMDQRPTPIHGLRQVPLIVEQSGIPWWRRNE